MGNFNKVRIYNRRLFIIKREARNVCFSLFYIKKNRAIVAWFSRGLPMSKNVIPTERKEGSASHKSERVSDEEKIKKEIYSITQ